MDERWPDRKTNRVNGYLAGYYRKQFKPRVEWAPNFEIAKGRRGARPCSACAQLNSSLLCIPRFLRIAHAPPTSPRRCGRTDPPACAVGDPPRRQVRQAVLTTGFLCFTKPDSDIIIDQAGILAPLPTSRQHRSMHPLHTAPPPQPLPPPPPRPTS